MVAYSYTHLRFVSRFLSPETIFKTRGRCYFCGEGQFTKTDRATREHMVPKIRGGSDDESNFVVACQSCNSEKSDMTVEEYREVIQCQQMLFSMRVGLMPRVRKIIFYGERF